MNHTTTCLLRLLASKRGSVALLTGVGFVATLGFASLAVDVGYVLWAQNALQASTQAAALAGAKDIGVGGTPIATATSYSSVTGASAGKNLIAGATTVVMASGYPAVQCFKFGPACSTNQTPATASNGVQVQQIATVPLFFASLFGYSSMDITASATALSAGHSPPPLNVMFIVDATASMGNQDATCGTTKLKCAIQGFEILLSELWPCPSNLSSCGAATNNNVANPVDEAALLQFPGVQAAPNGSCASLSTVSYAGTTAQTSSTTPPTSNVLNFTTAPGFPTDPTSLVTDLTNPSFIAAGTYLTSANNKNAVLSQKPTATIGNGKGKLTSDTIAVWPPVYQIIPLSSDYRTSDTATSLNTSSPLVSCLESLQPPGGFGTFYADAIKIAQANLIANTRAGARNVIILLSDGEANATAANTVSQGATTTNHNECKQAVIEAQNAAAAGTWVYAVSYGTVSAGGCTTDTGSYANACYAMGQIANIPGTTAGTFVNDPSKFFADNANGCRSPGNPNITALNSIFQNIEYSLTKTRLLPLACNASSPPTWC